MIVCEAESTKFSEYNMALIAVLPNTHLCTSYVNHLKLVHTCSMCVLSARSAPDSRLFGSDYFFVELKYLCFPKTILFSMFQAIGRCSIIYSDEKVHAKTTLHIYNRVLDIVALHSD